jgi:hypothetical protein
MTYTASLDFLVDECASKASTVWTMSTHCVNEYERYEHDLLSLGMISWLTILGTMVIISLGSLAHMLHYYCKNYGTMGTNLIGGGTSDELVRKVGLVVWSSVVLSPVISTLCSTYHEDERTSR